MSTGVCIPAVRNNAATRNLNTLLAHMLVRLTRVEGMTEADTLNTVNLVFLGRTFLKFMLDVVDGPGVIAQLDAGTCVVPRVVPRVVPWPEWATGGVGVGVVVVVAVVVVVVMQLWWWSVCVFICKCVGCV